MDSLLTDRDLEILDLQAARHHADRARSPSGCELLWANEVAALPIGLPGEALDDDQVRYAGIVAEIDDPDARADRGRRAVRACCRRRPGAITGPAPQLDADGDVRAVAHGWSRRGTADA